MTTSQHDHEDAPPGLARERTSLALPLSHVKRWPSRFSGINASTFLPRSFVSCASF